MPSRSTALVAASSSEFHPLAPAVNPLLECVDDESSRRTPPLDATNWPLSVRRPQTPRRSLPPDSPMPPTLRPTSPVLHSFSTRRTSSLVDTKTCVHSLCIYTVVVSDREQRY